MFDGFQILTRRLNGKMFGRHLWYDRPKSKRLFRKWENGLCGANPSAYVMSSKFWRSEK